MKLFLSARHARRLRMQKKKALLGARINEMAENPTKDLTTQGAGTDATQSDTAFAQTRQIQNPTGVDTAKTQQRTGDTPFATTEAGTKTASLKSQTNARKRPKKVVSSIDELIYKFSRESGTFLQNQKLLKVFELEKYEQWDCAVFRIKVKEKSNEVSVDVLSKILLAYYNAIIKSPESISPSNLDYCTSESCSHGIHSLEADNTQLSSQSSPSLSLSSRTTQVSSLLSSFSCNRVSHHLLDRTLEIETFAEDELDFSHFVITIKQQVEISEKIISEHIILEQELADMYERYLGLLDLCMKANISSAASQLVFESVDLISDSLSRCNLFCSKNYTIKKLSYDELGRDPQVKFKYLVVTSSICGLRTDVDTLLNKVQKFNHQCKPLTLKAVLNAARELNSEGDEKSIIFLLDGWKVKLTQCLNNSLDFVKARRQFVAKFNYIKDHHHKSDYNTSSHLESLSKNVKKKLSLYEGLAFEPDWVTEKIQKCSLPDLNFTYTLLAVQHENITKEIKMLKFQ